MVATCNKNFTKHSRKEKHNITVQHAVKFWSRRFMKLESTGRLTSKHVIFVNL